MDQKNSLKGVSFKQKSNQICVPTNKIHLKAIEPVVVTQVGDTYVISCPACANPCPARPSVFCAHDATGGSTLTPTFKTIIFDKVTLSDTNYSNDTRTGLIQIKTSGLYEINYCLQFQTRRPFRSRVASVKGFVERLNESSICSAIPGSSSTCSLISEISGLTSAEIGKTVVIELQASERIRIRFNLSTAITACETAKDSSLVIKKLY